MFNRSILIILGVALAAGLGLVASQRWFGPATAPAGPELQAVRLFPQPRELPPFALQQSDGTQLVPGELHGHWTLVFLGFTHCPDVCPTSMIEMAEARRLLGADGERLQGIFISVDPERDTPEIMREYMDSFDPSFLALHVSAEALPELAKRFRIVYQKVEGPTPTSYTMDHSAGSYVYDTQGRVRLYERYGSGAQALADDVKKLLSEG